MSTYLGSAGVDALAAELRRMPTEMRREMRPALRRAGNTVKARAARNASWSSRIPASLTVTTSMSPNRSAVAIAARRSVAPHARPYEGITGGATFRHPVFGGDVWVAQRARPFLAPAVLAERDTVLREVYEAAQAVVARL